jgi:hypothetical protein
MAADIKRAIGITMVGCAMATVGSVMLIAGKTAIALPFLGAGITFLAVGMAAARKAVLPGAGKGTQPPIRASDKVP